MICRDHCAACCIVPSISSPLPGMPGGKPTGVPCVHLTAELKCGIYNDPARPDVCNNFKADPEVCGTSREEAFTLLRALEQEEAP